MQSTKGDLAEGSIGDGTLSKKGYAASHASGFKDFKLKPERSRAIDDCGFAHPSGAQRECIPQAISGTDISARPSSARVIKTVAFALACLQQIDAAASGVRVLVICQSREPARQTNLVVKRFRRHFAEVESCVLFERFSIANYSRLLQANDPQIVIGMPGRLLGICEKAC